MAQNSKEPQANSKKAQSNSAKMARKGTPMIVEKVHKLPVVNFALSMGFSQYDRLKSSNVTVGEVMTKAENIVSYFWQKFQPIVEKLQDPINKADQLACNTFDFVEDKLNTMRIPQSLDMIVTKCKGAPTTM